MKIVMLGWEYPPSLSGGLGIASKGLAEALVRKGHHVSFVVPSFPPVTATDGSPRMVSAEKLNFPSLSSQGKRTLESTFHHLHTGARLLPYLPPDYFKNESKGSDEPGEAFAHEVLEQIPLTGGYGDQLLAQIEKYTVLAASEAISNSYELVHCHDWMTFRAGMAIRESTGIPFVAHVHSTEYDRNGAYANSIVQSYEKEGLAAADQVIAVSNGLKNTIHRMYQVPLEKITVIPNGADRYKAPDRPERKLNKIGFVGRFADQKSPGIFLDIARELLNRHSSLEFVMAGDGYLMDQVRQKINSHNLSAHCTLTGFLTHEDVRNLMDDLDVVVVPSVSEPFGLVALEAIQSGVAVVVSKGAGITEWVPTLKTHEAWDVYHFTATIESLLQNKKEKESYIWQCNKEASELTWEKSALLAENLYQKII